MLGAVKVIGLDRRFAGGAAVFDAVQPGEELGNGHVKLRRYVLVEINLREQGNEFGRFMNIDAVFLGPGDDLFGNQSPALGYDPRRSIGLAVGEGNRLAGRVILLIRHA